MGNDPHAGAPERSRLLAASKAAGAAGSRAGLSVVDWYHRYSLRIRAGQRAVGRTVRVRISDEKRRRISARQGNRCMYCGITLNRNNREIDHIYPVEFGGKNEGANLQALCKPCNARKGVQTDADFRHRYRELLACVSVGTPPSVRIPQNRCRAITRRTRQGETTRRLRQSVFRAPMQKIMAGSAVAGGVLGGVWFLAMPLIFGARPVVDYVALFGGLIVFSATWVGSMWRARVTGVLEQEQ